MNEFTPGTVLEYLPTSMIDEGFIGARICLVERLRSQWKVRLLTDVPRRFSKGGIYLTTKPISAPGIFKVISTNASALFE